MMGENEWIKEYFMLNFNFGRNHKCVCVRTGIILVKEWGQHDLVHRYFGSQN